MAKVPYVKYEDMDEFYTIQNVCRLFQMNKSQLKEKCDYYDVSPTRNEIGQFGFHKYDVNAPVVLSHALSQTGHLLHSQFPPSE